MAVVLFLSQKRKELRPSLFQYYGHNYSITQSPTKPINMRSYIKFEIEHAHSCCIRLGIFHGFYYNKSPLFHSGSSNNYN